MIYAFADCTLDTHLYIFQRAGQTIKLRRKVFEACRYLLEHRDRVISKDELIEQVWPEQFISDTTLESTIREARQALGDSGRAQRIIQTLHGRGYRFVATVEERPSVHSGSAAQESAELRDEPAVLAAPGSAPQGVTVRAPGPLVGWEQELAALHATLDRVIQGQGHTVGLVGEPDVGKSRLLATFRESLDGRPITYLEARGHPWGVLLPYLPLRALLRQYCQISDTDTAEVIRAAVESRLQAAAIPPAERVEYVLRLLGVQNGGDGLAALQPAIIRIRTCATLRQMFLAGSRQQPLIIVIEELQWLDDTSRQWLTSLIHSLANAPLLVLTTYRPGYCPPWGTMAQTSEMIITPLPTQPTLEMPPATPPTR